MSKSERGRSPDLDQVRQLLFPDLPPAEGWARIDAARRGASDPERWAAIEALAAGNLNSDLLARLRELRDDQVDETDQTDETDETDETD